MRQTQRNPLHGMELSDDKHGRISAHLRASVGIYAGIAKPASPGRGSAGACTRSAAGEPTPRHGSHSGLNINAITSPEPESLGQYSVRQKIRDSCIGRKSAHRAGLVYLCKMGLTREMVLCVEVRSAQHTVVAVDVIAEAPHNCCPFVQTSG